MRFKDLLITTTSAAAVAAKLVFTTGGALAQSSGSFQLEELIVSSRPINDTLIGLMRSEQLAKSRSSVGAEFIETQQAGQSIAQSINLLPGVNFTNNDPYGSSGGNLRLRSFDGNRISVTFDGMPLNDTGNYAIYTNQLLDPEIIARTTVNQGTTDVDSPTASATGGTIGIQSISPSDTMKFTLSPSIGTNNYKRIFAMIEPGTIGPWDTKSFLAMSYQKYDKFKGPGTLEKIQLNGKVLQEFGKKDFISLGFHYNRNRNNAYRSVTRDDLAQFGFKFDYFATCGFDAPTASVRDNDNAGNANDTTSTASCTNLFTQRINPSNTGNIRLQSSFGLTDTLRLNVDPSLNYTLATGGTGSAVFDENTGRLRGSGTIATQAAGVDLNGDGDLLDAVRLWGPSVTNTHRYGVTASLLWQALDNDIFRVAYTLDRGNHRQTGDYARLQDGGSPISYFPGRDGRLAVKSADGVNLRFRDRKSVAELQQVAVSYDGKFLDDMLSVSAGLRAPFFTRELNQYCYTAVPNTAYCTTQTPSAVGADRFVTFPAPLANTGSSITTRYLPPFAGTKKYDKLLPNVGLALRPFGEEHMLYISFAQGLSAPRTDNLYTAVPIGVQPETTDAYDIGYRYQTQDVMLSTTVWKSDFKNRIVTSYDPDTLTSIDRNVGPVHIWGVEGEAGVKPLEGLSLYGSAAYNHSKVLNDIVFGVVAGVQQIARTAGKKLVETPDWTFSLRAEYEIGMFQFGLQGKYTGDRYATDVNDEKAADYTIFDANARYSFADIGMENAYAQFNVTNLLGKHYLGSISTRVTNVTGAPGFSGLPTYNIASPRTIQGSLHFEF